MTVYDLNRDQLEELKQNHIIEKYDGELGWGEVMELADRISDDEIRELYSVYSFSPDDFASSAGEDEEDVKVYDLDVDANASKVELASDLREIANAIENDYYSGSCTYGTTWSIE